MNISSKVRGEIKINKDVFGKKEKLIDHITKQMCKMYS